MNKAMGMTRRNALNAFLDVRSNLCYTQVDAQQDYDFSGDGCHAGRSAASILHPIVHPRERGKSKGLSTAMLYEYGVLYHVAAEYRSFVAATRQQWLSIGGQHDIRANGICPSVKPTIGRSSASKN